LTEKYFPLIEKCFPLTNFYNGKQTQESLESDFPETIFWKTNIAFNAFSHNSKREASMHHMGLIESVVVIIF